MLEQPQQDCERPNRGTIRASVVEREVLTMLRRPAGYPPSVEGIVRELLSSFSESQIQSAITKLIKDGRIEAVQGKQLKQSIVLIPSPMKARKLH